MANTGKQSPLGVNVLGSYLSDTGLTINKEAAKYMGVSKTNASYSFGTCVSQTVLRMLTWAINDGYARGWEPSTTLTATTYNNLISIGANTIPALGNSMPSTYKPIDPSGVWARPSLTSTTESTAEKYGKQNANAGGYSENDVLPGPATSGYGNYLGSYGDSRQGYGLIDQKQNATWYPYNTTNPNHSITQWGYIRLHALQAWNEFNWNADSVTRDTPEYKEFCSSFMTAASYIDYINQGIMAGHNSDKFLDGAYSNMNDLVSADIAGISLSARTFGQDLENLGKAFNLDRLDGFGLPSVLLATMAKCNAINQDLSLLLLATGLSIPEIDNIAAGQLVNPSKEVESKLYGAFLLVTGENLAAILAPMQVKTLGLTSLADLLDVKKIFPNSYQSLTVPMYNKTRGLPTNSKTYYLIYKGTGLNSALNSTAMRDYVGNQIPKGKPIVSSGLPDTKNISSPKKGFGSYLEGILPQDQAIAAGALQFSMRQVRNINRVNFKRFSKAVRGMENMQGLPLTAGTSKPTNQEQLNNLKTKMGLGTGPYGTYTFSDFFGCMSGLPYPWQKIQKRLNQLSTPQLASIYKELFLAVTWEQATAVPVITSRTVETSPGIFTTYYKLVGITITDSGGGYGRGAAPNPTVTVNWPGVTATATIGTNDNNAGSVGGGTFGRVTAINFTGGSELTYNPGGQVQIQAPPTVSLTVPVSGAVSGGVNTPYGTTGWAQPMNGVVQSYIDQANQAIAQIYQDRTTVAKYLNSYWDTLGTQLKVEHRSRYIAISPVPVAKDLFMNPYPMMTQTFIDSIPQLSQDTKPHMSAQTLEYITDKSTTGGQSTIGQMRQERNQARLQHAGIDLDNDISVVLTDQEIKTLITNGVLPAATDDTGINGYTTPAWSEAIPEGFFIPDPTTLAGTFVPISQTQEGDITPILELPNNELNDPNINPVVNNELNDPNINPVVNSVTPVGVTNAVTPTGIGGPAGISDAVLPNNAGVPNNSLVPAQSIPIIAPPSQLDPDNLPANLDPNYMSSTMLPSSPTVPEAIEQVIECNCDCWID